MKLKNKYEKLEKVGQGSFGKVFKVRNRATREFMVMKEIDMSMMNLKMKKDAENEVNILKSLKNQHILQFVESFKQNKYCEKGDLSKYIKGQIKLISEDIIMKIFVQVCMGLNYLHSERILHRDIKAMNIFLKKNFEIRIGDLGVAKNLKANNFAHTVIGTPYYLSPELCLEMPYNEKNDVWALGCLLYEMCKQTQPFKANQNKNLMKVIRKELRELISSMLLTDQIQRPSMKDIILNDYVQKKIKLYEKNRAAEEINNNNIKGIVPDSYKKQFNKKKNLFLQKKKLEKTSQKEIKNNMFNELMQGKKVSQILKEEDNNIERKNYEMLKIRKQKPKSKSKSPSRAQPIVPINFNRRRSIESNITKNDMKKQKKNIKVIEKNFPKKKKNAAKLNIHKKDKSFFSNLEREYKKNVKGFLKMENKFKKLEEKSENNIDKNQFQNFHQEISNEMDFILNVNKDIQFEKDFLKKTKNQKPKISKKEKIKKDFGEWFTEDYFEQCLKQEGELISKNEFENSFRKEESIRDRHIHYIKRDFDQKELNEQQELNNSFKCLSMEFSSNNKMLSSISHGYTVSNKRNRFGKYIAGFLVKRKEKRVISENNSFFNEYSFDKRISPLKKLRKVLKNNNGGMKRILSCEHLRSTETFVNKKSLLYVQNEMKRCSSSLIKKSPEKEQNVCLKNYQLKIYIKYHDLMMKVMNSFLKLKWNDEIENFDLMTNPKIQPQPKKPLIYVQNNKKIIQNKQYIIASSTNAVERKDSKDVTTLNPQSEENRNIFHRSISFNDGVSELSDIREFKIPEERNMNTVEELSYFERINIAEEKEAERQLNEYLNNQDKSLLNNFTKIKNKQLSRSPFKKKNKKVRNSIKKNNIIQTKPQKKISKKPSVKKKIMNQQVIPSKVNKSLELRKLFNMNRLKQKEKEKNKDISFEKNEIEAKRILKSRSVSKNKSPQKGISKSNIFVSESTTSKNKSPRRKFKSSKKKQRSVSYKSQKKAIKKRNPTKNNFESKFDEKELDPFKKNDKIQRSIKENEYVIDYENIENPFQNNSRIERSEKKIEPVHVEQSLILDEPEDLRLSAFIKKGNRYKATPKLGFKKQEEDLPFDLQISNLVIDESELSIRRTIQNQKKFKTEKKPKFCGFSSKENINMFCENEKKINNSDTNEFNNKNLINNIDLPKIEETNIKDSFRNEIQNIDESIIEKNDSSFISSVNCSFITSNLANIKKKKRKRKKNLSRKKIMNKELIKKLNSKKSQNDSLISNNFSETNNILKNKSFILNDLSQPNNIILEESFDERKNRWEEERNERKKERSSSQQKFYKSLRHSLSKISSRLNSIQKKPTNKNEIIQSIIKNSSILKESQNLGEIRKIIKTPSKNNLVNQSMHSPSLNNTSMERKTLNSGKLNDFLKSFSLVDQNFGFSDDKKNKETPKKKISPEKSEIIRKPIMNNKNLKYLIESVQEDKKEFNHRKESDLIQENESFMQSGIPLSVSHSESENREKDYSEMNQYRFENHRKSRKLEEPKKILQKNKKKMKEKIADDYNWNIKEIKKLNKQKKSLVSDLCGEIQRETLNQFLKQVFKKFNSIDNINERDLQQLNKKYFSDFELRNKEIMNSLYELIEVEIAIQSKTLTCLNI